MKERLQEKIKPKKNRNFEQLRGSLGCTIQMPQKSARDENFCSVKVRVIWSISWGHGVDHDKYKTVRY